MRFILILLGLALIGWSLIPAQAMEQGDDLMNTRPEGYPVATLAGGCFWCLESELRALDGILYTRVGYTGGHTENPTYEQISTGKTGHAEAVEITFDPDKVSYADLVKFFLTEAHDPTTLNYQGVDHGTQYRSAIYYHDDEQEKIARDLVTQVNGSKRYKNPIVTEIEPASTFYEAETYHQQYYEKYEEKTGQQHIRVQLKKFKKLKP